MVLGKVSDFVYEIQLPPKSRHLTVHHDRLKPFHGEFQGWLPKEKPSVDTTAEPGSIENARESLDVSQSLQSPSDEHILNSHSQRVSLRGSNDQKSKSKGESVAPVVTCSGRQSKQPSRLTYDS